MSGETRAHHRRSSREAARRAQQDLGVSLVAAWCESEQWIPQAKKKSHDTLIELCGAKRRGGVRWTVDTGPEAKQRLSELQAVTSEPGLANYYRQLAGKLREFGGWIVVAMCESVE